MEGSHGDKDVDRDHIDVVVIHNCCVVVCVSLLPLSLSIRVLVVVVLVALGGKGMLAMILIEDVLMLLLMIRNC